MASDSFRNRFAAAVLAAMALPLLVWFGDDAVRADEPVIVAAIVVAGAALFVVPLLVMRGLLRTHLGLLVGGGTLFALSTLLASGLRGDETVLAMLGFVAMPVYGIPALALIALAESQITRRRPVGTPPF